jgi:hypothetical protein
VSTQPGYNQGAEYSGAITNTMLNAPRQAVLLAGSVAFGSTDRMDERHASCYDFCGCGARKKRESRSCHACYNADRWGDPASRFWAKVDRSGGPEVCWLWTAGTKSSGYGEFSFQGGSRPAHQVAWELANGEPFPEGMFGCHHCDNPPCVNPAHIFVGTTADNMHDALSKGRLPRSVRLDRCRRGLHPLTGTNVYTSKNGRQCRQCRNAASRSRDAA